MTTASIPMPPLELRQMAGPGDPAAFDNPGGQPIYAGYGLSFPPDTYESVFDFGCGCGRLARQLLQQNPRPRRYVGIDVHRGMVDWCRQNLTPVDSTFQFSHHDVYAPGYAPDNSLQLAQPFPVHDATFSLVIAHSVFTHLFRRQTEYYLREIARILTPQGVAFTSWFFFDRDSFPFLLEGPFCLFTGETTPTEAVIYDRRWFLDAVRQAGLGVKSTTRPGVPGHQWPVFLMKRNAGTVDQFPLGEESAGWLCGATLKPIATSAVPREILQKEKVAPSDPQAEPRWPETPALFGSLAELNATKRQLEHIRQSWLFRLAKGTIVTPARTFKKLLRS